MDEENRQPKTSAIIDDIMIPVRNTGITVREEMEDDGKYILYNAENELILVLNPTGKFILDNCNGKKTVMQIAGDIGKHFTVPDDIDLLPIVKDYISTLSDAKLVAMKGDKSEY